MPDISNFNGLPAVDSIPAVGGAISVAISNLLASLKFLCPLLSVGRALFLCTGFWKTIKLIFFACYWNIGTFWGTRTVSAYLIQTSKLYDVDFGATV